MMASFTFASHLSQSSSGWSPLSQMKLTPNGEQAIVDCAMFYVIRAEPKGE